MNSVARRAKTINQMAGVQPVKTTDRRASAARRGYGRRWRKFRAIERNNRPMICAECGRIAERMQLDHVVARSQGGADSRDNTQWLCPSCHSRKTVQQDGGLGRPQRPGRGV